LEGTVQGVKLRPEKGKGGKCFAGVVRDRKEERGWPREGERSCCSPEPWGGVKLTGEEGYQGEGNAVNERRKGRLQAKRF